MPHSLCSRFTFFFAALWLTPAAFGDWLSLPSTYTHSPLTGQRVHQYQPIASPTAAVTPISSGGFSHTRSTLNYGKSADNYFRVQRWGEPVQPFAAFRFPFRPYGTPYPNWGAPFTGLGTNIQFGPVGFGTSYGSPTSFGPFNGVNAAASGRPGPNPFGAVAPGDYPRFPSDRFRGGFEQPISPLVPYPAVPINPDRVSPLYDGHYPTYRD